MIILRSLNDPVKLLDWWLDVRMARYTDKQYGKAEIRKLRDFLRNPQ